MIISLDLSSRFFFATHLCLLSGSVTTSVVGDARDDLCGFCAAEAAPTRRRRRRLIRSDLKSYPMIVAVCCVSSFYMIIKCSAAKLLPHRVVARPQISRKRRQMIFFLVQHTHTHTDLLAEISLGYRLSAKQEKPLQFTAACVSTRRAATDASSTTILTKPTSFSRQHSCVSKRSAKGDRVR